MKFNNINPDKVDYTIQSTIEKIKNGFEVQSVDVEKDLEESDRLKFNDCIILKPEYQREYRSSQEDESSLIESVLVGIPIPPIFLASIRLRGVQVLDVVDGQHRLSAFYRFCKNQFKLKGLTLIEDLNGKSFDEIEYTMKETIFSYPLSAYVFRNFPGKEFELEIFNRYNKGTKPLSPQEIRHAVYNSIYNEYITQFVKSLLDGNDELLKKAYNITTDRYLKKKIHETIFVIWSILENGINPTYKDSTTYAEEYMKSKSSIDETQDEIENFEIIKEYFNSFNVWIKSFMDKVEYPFSKEIYGISSRNYKFQMSIAMILTATYKKIYIDKQIDFEDDDEYLKVLKDALLASYIEDPDYNASTTNSIKMNELILSFGQD